MWPNWLEFMVWRGMRTRHAEKKWRRGKNPHHFFLNLVFFWCESCSWMPNIGAADLCVCSKEHSIFMFFVKCVFLLWRELFYDVLPYCAHLMTLGCHWTFKTFQIKKRTLDKPDAGKTSMVSWKLLEEFLLCLYQYVLMSIRLSYSPWATSVAYVKVCNRQGRFRL